MQKHKNIWWADCDKTFFAFIAFWISTFSVLEISSLESLSMEVSSLKSVVVKKILI